MDSHSSPQRAACHLLAAASVLSAGPLAAQSLLFEESVRLDYAYGTFRHHESLDPDRRDRADASRLTLDALLARETIGLRGDVTFSDGDMFADTPAGASRALEFGGFVYLSHEHRQHAFALRTNGGLFSKAYENDDPRDDTGRASSQGLRLELAPTFVLLEGRSARLDLVGRVGGFAGFAWLGNDRDRYHESGSLLGYDLSAGVRLGFVDTALSVGYRLVADDWDFEREAGGFGPLETGFEGVWLMFTGRF